MLSSKFGLCYALSRDLLVMENCNLGLKLLHMECDALENVGRLKNIEELFKPLLELIFKLLCHLL